MKDKTNNFYDEITVWLLPKGYSEIYSNHPCLVDREFHFCKNGIRVICVSSHEDYCYLYIDILKEPYNLALKTGKFEIGTNELEKIHKYIKTNSDLLRTKKRHINQKEHDECMFKLKHLLHII